MAIRNIRRDAMHHLRELKKEGEVARTTSAAPRRAAEAHGRGASARSTALLKGKEEEILEV